MILFAAAFVSGIIACICFLYTLRQQRHILQSLQLLHHTTYGPIELEIILVKLQRDLKRTHNIASGLLLDIGICADVILSDKEWNTSELPKLCYLTL
jgi:hypothetical protein